MIYMFLLIKPGVNLSPIHSFYLIFQSSSQDYFVYICKGHLIEVFFFSLNLFINIIDFVHYFNFSLVLLTQFLNLMIHFQPRK